MPQSSRVMAASGVLLVVRPGRNELWVVSLFTH